MKFDGSNDCAEEWDGGDRRNACVLTDYGDCGVADIQRTNYRSTGADPKESPGSLLNQVFDVFGEVGMWDGMRA